MYTQAHKYVHIYTYTGATLTFFKIKFHSLTFSGKKTLHLNSLDKVYTF